jgi:peroxiredoxin
MTIKIGERLPSGQIQEYVEVETAGCSIGPNRFDVDALLKGKTIVIFGLPGAFTPTCSAQHVPGYLRHHDEIKHKGVDEIWCFAVNDAFVMGAWGRDQKTNGRIRMMADGSGEYTAKLGLEFDLRAAGLGMRCQRFSMLVQDGTVKKLNVEAAGKFEVSSAEALLRQLG